MGKKRPKLRSPLSDPNRDIQPVLYEVLTLAQALRQMRREQTREIKEIAKVAAANSCRALLHFLFDLSNPPAPTNPKDAQEKPAHSDDIILEDWVARSKCKALIRNHTLREMIPRFDKYVSHLTMTRISPPPKIHPPTRRMIKDAGREIVRICKDIFDDCRRNGVRLSRKAKQHYAALERELALKT